MNGAETDPYNATVDLLERNLAPGRAGRPYLMAEDRTWSYEEVARAADAAGAGLRDLGLTRGDRVLLITRDCPEFVITFWGAMKAGLVAVPVALGLSASDLRFILVDSEARAVVCDLPSAAGVAAAAQASRAECLLIADSPRDGTRSWHEVCGGEASLEPEPTTGDDTALWLYTSGTTGLPKGVVHRHRHLRAAPAGLSEQVIGMEPEDVVLSVSRMFFAYGLGNSVYLPASAGAAVVVNEGPVLPAPVQEILDRHPPTVLFGVPAFFNGFVRLPDSRIPSSVRTVITAGEALSVDLFERFKNRFGVVLLDGLGSTEALHHFTSNRPGDVVPGSAGAPLTGYEVKALDRAGQPVPEGEKGELWVRGPTTFEGYWKRPELTARAYNQSWMRTGDVVRVSDGRVYYQGRLDDLIKMGGIWLAPTEVEDVLRGHEDVQDAAIVAIDDGSGVPVLKALVRSERRDDALPKELLGLCRGRLASFKVPTSFEVVEELPRTPSGKLRRFILKDRFGGSPGI
jgi:benzoate-CoA ligase family protein